MRLKSEDGLEIELWYESDVLTTSFFEKDNPKPLSVLKTRGQESTQVIAYLKRRTT